MQLSRLALFAFAPSAKSVYGFTTHNSNGGRTKTFTIMPRMSFQPIANMFGDMASSLLNKPVPANTKVDNALPQFVSWSDIRNNLESQFASDDERNFRNNLEKGLTSSPLNKVRVYDTDFDTNDIRVTFYRDSASWCPYCQKVWATLEEKQIPYRIEKVNMSCYGDKPMSFRKLQPSGQIPVAVIDKVTYRQSNDILYALEELFPDHKSMLPPNNKKTQAQALLRLERQLFSAWMYWLTSGVNKNEFIATLAQVEAALRDDGPFFLGNDVSIVDMQFVPFLERMAASMLYYKGFKIRVAPGEATNYPAINRWFDSMESLESYRLTKSDYFTHCWDLPPQLGGCIEEAEGQPYRDAIDGSIWTLGDLSSKTSDRIEPGWSWIDPDYARRQAVERVSTNHEAIVRFAARGAGSKGMPPVSAPLADPNAKPSEGVIKSVDAMIRLVCMGILDGVAHHQTEMNQTAKVIADNGDKVFVDGVVNSLEYLRDRVGVPRDMSLPAAQQLRAHLNWAIDALREQATAVQ